MLEVTYAAAQARLRALSDRNEAAAAAALRRPAKVGKPSAWLTEVRGYLIEAFDQGLIRDPPATLHGLLRLSPFARPPSEDALAVFHAITTGPVNFDNDPTQPCVHRSDGAWFDFGFILRELRGEVELYSYRFALRLPVFGAHGLLRVDLNPPGHQNDDRGLRAHTHLFTDDDGYSVPSPVMTPVEVLDVLLFRLQPTGRTRS